MKRVEMPHSNGQSGKANTFALVGIGLVLAYAKFAPYYLAIYPAVQKLVPAIHIAAVILIGAVACFAVLCQMHLTSIGAQSANEVRSLTTKRLEEISQYIVRIEDELGLFQRQLGKHAGGLSRHGEQAIHQVRRILRALIQRHSDASTLATSPNSFSRLQASDLIYGSLDVDSNALTGLIDSEPIHNIQLDKIEETVEQLMATVRRELRIAA